MSRIFNANVGDESTGNAGPDAIEQDLDNLYRDKADKTEVLTKSNTTEYIPTQDYNPSTKKYVDSKATETLQTVNQSLTLINTDIDDLNTDISSLDTDKADKTNVLELDNETEYTPTTDYHPVTKKYVDDEVDLLSERIGNHYTTGTYTGAVDTTKTITLTFEPSVVIIQESTSPTFYTIINGYDCMNSAAVAGEIIETGFTVSDILNTDATVYNYIALK